MGDDDEVKQQQRYSKGDAFCSTRFPGLWSQFVDTMADVYNSKRSYSRNYSCARLQRLGGGMGGELEERQQQEEERQQGCGPDPPPAPPQTELPAVEKLVAIGDLHGDVDKARRAFRLAGLVDEHGSWIGGKTSVVQVGDVLDRGQNEVELYYWLEKLGKEACDAGGAVHVLNGNHETMNVARQSLYATQGGFADFSKWARTHGMALALKARCLKCSSNRIEDAKTYVSSSEQAGPAARHAALSPGGDFSRRFIAPNPVVLKIGSTVFVHGGLLPHHAEYGIDAINRETQRWVLEGKVEEKPPFLSGRSAVVWARDYSNEDPERCDCKALEETLAKIPGSKRMVVGHTIQGSGINSACNEKVFRVDVGLSRGCGDGTPEVLVIHNDNHVVRLKENSGEVEDGESPAGKFKKLEKLSEKLLHEN